MNNEIKKVLRSLYLDEGDPLFSDKNKLRSAISDLLTSYPNEAKLLKLAVSEDVGRRLVAEQSKPLANRIPVYAKKMADTYNIGLSTCYDAVETLAFAISGDNSVFSIGIPEASSESHERTSYGSGQVNNGASYEPVNKPVVNPTGGGQTSANPTSNNNAKVFGVIALAVLLLIIVAVAKSCGGSNASTQTSSSYVSAQGQSTSVGASAQQSSTASLHDLKTLSTEWGSGEGNYYSERVSDYYGNEYSGYYDFAASDSRESFVRVATKGEWRYLSGTYFPRAWESGDYYVRLSIYADDTLVFQGDWMGLESRAASFNVDIKNCDVLKIVVNSENTGSMPYITPGIELVDATVSK